MHAAAPRMSSDSVHAARLVAAVASGWVERAREAVASGGGAGEGGSAALVRAVQIGSHEMVDLLLGAGVDCNARDEGGVPVLFHAVRYGRNRTVRSLLVAGADANAVTRDGRGLLDCVHAQCHVYYAGWMSGPLLELLLACTDARRMADHAARVHKSQFRPLLRPWLEGRHELQRRRREVERVLYREVRPEMPADIVSLCGEFVHAGRLAVPPGGVDVA